MFELDDDNKNDGSILSLMEEREIFTLLWYHPVRNNETLIRTTPNNIRIDVPLPQRDLVFSSFLLSLVAVVFLFFLRKTTILYLLNYQPSILFLFAPFLLCGLS
mmetsp:Transcript_7443/g.8008  ORF Transcript_7443/g.8008 Transcript_7443/m.8008 type:complete len:104 (+) Transcript_7443:737-1048(+)